MSLPANTMSETEKPREKRRTKPKVVIDIKEVERLAAQGLNQTEIAHNLGICEKTLRNHKESDAEITAAIARGRSAGIKKAANVLDEILASKDVRARLDAAKFYLARRGAWAEKTEAEVSGAGGGPIVVQFAKDDEGL